MCDVGILLEECELMVGLLAKPQHCDDGKNVHVLNHRWDFLAALDMSEINKSDCYINSVADRQNRVHILTRVK